MQNWKKGITLLMLAIFVLSLISACGGPRVIVTRPAPPPLKREIKPARPFAGAVWIAGIWNWNGTKYVWISGRWVRPKPGHHWAPGHWDKVPGGWVWVKGHWR